MVMKIDGWQAWDGTYFDTEKLALAHEKKLDKQIKIEEAKAKVREQLELLVKKEYNFRAVMEDLDKWQQTSLLNLIVDFIYDNSEYLWDMVCEKKQTL